MYIDDLDTIIDFGKYSGMKLRDVPENYFNWLKYNIKNGNIYHVMNRISNRKGVTTLIKYGNIRNQILPPLDMTMMSIPAIKRPPKLDSKLYGFFVEYLVKYSLGMRKFKDVDEYLSNDTTTSSSGSSSSGGREKHTKRYEYINLSYRKRNLDASDLCNISLASSIKQNSYDENAAILLFKTIKDDIEYYNLYIFSLKSYFDGKYTLNVLDQERCDDISVGCITGVIDLILNDTIIDVKCRERDDVEYYQQQVYAYACLHRLRYQNKINTCQVYNFLTRNIFTMDVSSLDIKTAETYIRNLGSYNVSHLELFR